MRSITRGCRSGYEDGHKILVSANGEGFCEEFSKIVFTLKPSNYEVILAYAITYPMKVHINAFCSARCDGIVGYTDGTGVVAKDRSGGLRVSEAV